MPTWSHKTLLVVTDQQRSVLNVLDDHHPHPIAYSSYGHRPRENGMLCLLGFNGELAEPLTGHYLLGNGYRAFNPVLMRFNSPDNWSPFGKGGLNTYAYCMGDPVNWKDSTGHSASLFLQLLNGVKKQTANPIIKTSRIITPAKPTWKNSQPGTSKRISPMPAPMTRLNDMPNEILEKIFINLDGSDLTNVALTSKRMHGTVDHLSSFNMQNRLKPILPSNQLSELDAVGLGKIYGIAPSAAVKARQSIISQPTNTNIKPIKNQIPEVHQLPIVSTNIRNNNFP